MALTLCSGLSVSIMKNQIYIYIIFLMTSSLLFSCSGEHEIGKLPVEGLKDIYINLSQEDQFDSATAIYYEIVGNKNHVILKKYHLTGTHDYESDLTNFTANSHDSIIYLTYLEPNKVFAVYDLKTGKGYPHGSTSQDYNSQSKNGELLFNIIKSKNLNLKAQWKE